MTSAIELAHHEARRARLLERVGGTVLLLGNGPRARNLPMTDLPFRQDSTFLYFTGCDLPGAAALLRAGRFELFLPEPGEEDALWHGPTPSLEELGARFGADRVRPAHTLAAEVPGDARVLAVADEAVNSRAAAWTGRRLAFGRDHGDEALMDAVISLRRTKGPEEVAEMRAAAAATRQAFEATMQATVPGSHERGLWTLFEGVLRLNGCTTGYDTILTQSGEILHHHGHGAPLEAGRLVLLDGGGERIASGYTVDITRTWPVSGVFTPRQRAAYDAVLEAQRVAIEACTVGRPYREVHDAASLVLARFLADEGLLRGTPEGIVEQHAHALFFPHGVGHHLGLDVHDLENFGDRPSYAPGASRPEPFGTRNLRLDLPLEAGWVVTIEPGFYVVPAILANTTLRERFRGVLQEERAQSWLGFGGVRIEDDVHVTPDGPEVLTDVPKAPDAIEAIVGQGPTAEARLCP